MYLYKLWEFIVYIIFVIVTKLYMKKTVLLYIGFTSLLEQVI